jgi:carbohydrate-selective porin OprB
VYPIKDSGLYVEPGMYTANSSDTGWTIDDFFTKNEHFYHLDVGWSKLASAGVPLQARGAMDQDNFHVVAWYKNEQQGGLPEAHGVAFNANSKIGENLMWFLRGGWSEGFFVDWNTSGGIGWRPQSAPSDLLGFGVGWAHPSNDALRDQYTLELFYRFHVAPNFAISPDIQFIQNPALNPGENVLWVAGIRTRFSF